MERIHVTVRVRPLSPEDAKTSPWRISGNSISNPNINSSKFEFDRIFGENCKTQEVYEARTKNIVAAAICGFNGTVFAYGQTNSGKTHTMRGSTAEPGVIPRAVHDLFEIIQQDTDREFLLRMSYMEIYNEEINDLLAPEHRKLQIHESLERGIFVAGLREEIVASPEQVLEFMEFGESHRHIGETNMNLYSSRSHTIFRMIIESRNRCEDEDEDAGSFCDAVRVSVLNLVDLAGSERASKTGAEGVRLKEGSHINKSLMTLGTVIKKLSEGGESQGGHVPYRDSKLTRILQPALGGNANTAIICNITLAQIHADETKSSLQFASRALRVTNCARVNEILTDAALLKRQKKEIEELKAKLQGSHSEHFEEEILSLRNTLLQTELERERIALELEEEKKAQAEREKRLQEQAKKIENLSSMVLYSNRDENRDHPKKEKRRDTWCFGNLSKETLRELNSIVPANASAVKPMRSEHDVGPLLPFEELVSESSMDKSCKPEECNNGEVKYCTLPDPCALLHVTSRKKAPVRKKSLLVESNELEEFQAEYEDLLLKFETQRTMSEIQIDFLTRKLAESDLYLDEKPNSLNRSATLSDATKCLRESEAILVIKQLQEKINTLEMEKSSSQQSLDCVVELATEQKICAMEKYEELYEELLNAQEAARIACEELTAKESVKTTDMGNSDTMIKLLKEVQEITSEFQSTKNLAESMSLVTDELLESFSILLNLFFEFKSSACQNSVQLRSIVSDHGKLHDCMRNTVNELEKEKFILHNQSMNLQSQIQELNRTVQNSASISTDLSEEHDLEKAELLSHIQSLEKEISYLSSSYLARENENFRKDLEKTKTKLKDTDSKLKNAIQEKTKLKTELEGEKARAERELKKLQGQKALLERDMSKRESLAGRRRDSVVDRSSNVFDPKRPKGLPVSFEQTLQEDYKKLEVLAFEMETTIASLEEELAAANEEKNVAVSRTESLTSDLQALSDKLSLSNLELNTLQEEVSDLRLRLEESKSYNHKIEGSIKKLVEEKEELAMQLTEALLSMEEEKAVWSAREKASIEAIEDKSRYFKAEIALLSKETSEVRNELASCREECEALGEKLLGSEENAKLEKKFSSEKSLENDRLRENLRGAEDLNKKSQEEVKLLLKMLTLDHHHASEEVQKEKEYLVNQVKDLDKGSVLMDDYEILRNQLLVLVKEKDKGMTQIEEKQCHDVEVGKKLLKAKAEVEVLTCQLSRLEAKLHNDEVINNKEKTKLRMRLRGTQAKLEAFTVRYKEEVEKSDLMNRKFEEAAAKLKTQLAFYALEALNLRKQLVAVKSQ